MPRMATVEFQARTVTVKRLRVQEIKISQQWRARPGLKNGRAMVMDSKQQWPDHESQPSSFGEENPVLHEEKNRGTHQQQLSDRAFPKLSRRKARNSRKENSAQRNTALQGKQAEKELKWGTSKVRMYQGWKMGGHNWYWSWPVDKARRRRRQFLKDHPVSDGQRLPFNQLLRDHISQPPETSTGFCVFHTRRWSPTVWNWNHEFTPFS